jgi:hypothetical protein
MSDIADNCVASLPPCTLNAVRNNRSKAQIGFWPDPAITLIAFHLQVTRGSKDLPVTEILGQEFELGLTKLTKPSNK